MEASGAPKPNSRGLPPPLGSVAFPLVVKEQQEEAAARGAGGGARALLAAEGMVVIFRNHLFFPPR